MANKQMMMNIGLNELKLMKPEEMYCLVEQMQEISKQLETKKAQQNGI